MLSVQTPTISRDARIRALFEELGPMSTIAIARACVRAGIYTDDELELIHLRSIQSDVREALKKPDAQGLPGAGQTTERDEDNGRVWKARQLWMFADYELNIRDHVKQANAEHRQAMLLNAECEERFGQRVPMDMPL